MMRAMRDADVRFPLTLVTTLAEAFAWCRSRARSGESVLLSPACASFDAFDDYAHRGRVFEQLAAGTGIVVLRRLNV
jgi:UDP-N-acetylmuramoylalanine-D-glutamate ligase